MRDEQAAFVSIAALSKRTTLSRGTIYNMIDRGELPPPVRLTLNRVAFRQADIEAWIEALCGASGEASEREQQRAFDDAHRDAFAFATQGGGGLDPARYASRLAELGHADAVADAMRGA